MQRNDIRNVAIIAHVDHGKTTLVDGFLEHASVLEGEHAEAFLDSNPLERERGITILAKNISLIWKNTKINVIDTPGHADFGGEVERVLKMADGALLLVDAAEGPLPQTKFVLRKALALGLKPLLVINKVDRADARPREVVQLVYDLFIDLGATDEQINFPVFYASGKLRQSGLAPDKLEASLVPLLDGIIRHIPGPEIDAERPLQVMVTNFQYDEFVGRIGVGRIVSGVATNRMPVTVISLDGRQRKSAIRQLQVFTGLSRTNQESVSAGDIVALVGLDDVEIGDTVCHPDYPVALPPVPVDEPTVTMIFAVNNSPFAGQEGTYVTSRQISDRVFRAAEADVALRVAQGDTPEQFRVSGRGILHLGILIENMRREGYEFAVGAPKVIFKRIEDTVHEPVEEVVIDTPAETAGKCIELLGSVRGEMQAMESHGERTVLSFMTPSRGLIGMRTRILTATQGEAVFTHRFSRYEPSRGDLPRRSRGAIIATESGRTTEYALFNLEDRGVFFVRPGDLVYEGMVVGENCKDDDIIANVSRMKALTNIRSSNKEATVTLRAARDMSLEESLEWLADDELLEVTPKSWRIRKRFLKVHERKRAASVSDEVMEPAK